MSNTSKLKEERDALLDELNTAFNNYIDNEIKRNENIVSLVEGILKAHNTPTSAGQTVIDEISVLAELELSTYLTGQ